jgi:hypothetical protein
MLFLFNDRVLQIPSPQAIAGPLGANRSTALAAAIRAGREAIFAGGDASGINLDLLRVIAARIALNSDANAALFVRPERCKQPEQVGARLVEAPLTTLAYLLQRQAGRDRLDPILVNRQVWMVAAGAGKA